MSAHMNTSYAITSGKKNSRPRYECVTRNCINITSYARRIGRDNGAAYIVDRLHSEGEVYFQITEMKNWKQMAVQDSANNALEKLATGGP